jgi:oligopeptide/dipeptide ABC transporter ATP-binding protein
MSATVLEVRDLRVAFGEVEPVRGVSFVLRAGQRLGLVGESGSGKSLTALAIMRLARRARLAGSVLLDGTDLLTLSEREMTRVRGGRVAMVYQDPMAALNPVYTIGRQLREALELHTDLRRTDARERAIELLAEVGIERPDRRVDQYPHELSGGMRQRVVIAMAMCARPSVLICDEPTTALDVTTQARVIELLDRLADDHGTAVILITHDLAVAGGFCNEIHVMYGGRIVESAAVESLYRAPVHPYTSALLSAAVDLTLEPGTAIPTIPGQPPLAGALPSGCSFHPRCPAAREICSVQPPDLQVAGDRSAECHFAVERLARLDARLHA